MPIYTGNHVCSATRSHVVAFEELPLPKSDRAKLPPCTIRWQFTGRFNLNREEGIARGSLLVQARRYLEAKGIRQPDCLVNFPRGVGRGRYVKITVPDTQLATLSDVPLVFNGARPQRLFVGSAIPLNYLVIEILGVPHAHASLETARYIATSLRNYVQVHDVWVAQISYANDPTPPADTNRLVALVSTPRGSDGGLDPTKLHAIPGFLRNGNSDCKLVYMGRLQWCPTCRGNTGRLHTFEDCPRRKCFRCQETGHSAAVCTADFPIDDTDDDISRQQEAEAARGANNLNY
ncbi:uncharacterized protein UBRO2_02586 [Ustilago bromivora]|uniref:CCHC-type domain-containing protein n=1 Tax=Ustilago bromivora TaxID=307758 RepID=A0A8H8QL75_9BASI|nr:uncharacterized protein UBRO2_02586 [Ustilago bromivora]